jgi:hypothetical protein
MINLSWGGYANGSPELAAQCVQAVGGIPGDAIEIRTEQAWDGWRNAVHAQTGVWLSLDHSDIIAPGFRDVANQQAAWDRYQRVGRPVASHPPDASHIGSNHGWGRAIDVTGFESRNDVWAAMNSLAPQFGLSNATGVDSGERWHWESLNPPVTASVAGFNATAIPQQREDEDDMKVWKLGTSYIIVDHVNKKYRVLDNPVTTEWNGFKNSEDKGAYFVPIDQNGWTDLSKGFTRVW